jgi:hypothetical protein
MDEKLKDLCNALDEMPNKHIKELLKILFEKARFSCFDEEWIIVKLIGSRSYKSKSITNEAKTAVSGLIHLLNSSNESNLELRLKAINRVLYAESYGVSPSQLDALMKDEMGYNTLARGWELREWMGKLSYFVTLKNYGEKNTLTAYIRTRTPEERHLKSLFLEDDFQHLILKKNATLQSTAIDLYIEQLNEEGIYDIERGTLKDDLKAVANWDKVHQHELSESSLLDAPFEYLPIPPPYSTSWKDSRQKR